MPPSPAHARDQQRKPGATAQATLGRGPAPLPDHSRHEREIRVADVMVRFPRTHGPGSSLEEIRELFEDDRVHMALIVTADGSLVTTIERADLAAAVPGSAFARELGTLTGRTAGPADPLDAATAALTRDRRRRLAVVDASGRLLGLLCLKKDGTGYCSDDGIRERPHRRACLTHSRTAVSVRSKPFAT